MNASPSLQVAKPARRTPSGGFGLSALSALYVLTLRQHLNGKRWMVLGVLFLAPAILAGIVRATASDMPPLGLEFLFVFLFIPQALLPLVALLYGSGIIQDEQEEQTLTYLLIRPLPCWSIYLVKMLATLTTTILLTAVFTALTYAVIYLGTDEGAVNVLVRCLKAIGVHALAVVAYCCLFGLMSLLTRWTLVLGFFYAAVVEGLLGNLPFCIRLLTVIYYARLIAYRSMEFLVAEPSGEKEDVAAILWRLDVKADPGLAEHPGLVTCLIVLALGSILCTLLGCVLCSAREFHVKTPGGS